MTEKLVLARAAGSPSAGWHSTEVARTVPMPCAQPLTYSVDPGSYLQAPPVPRLAKQRPRGAHCWHLALAPLKSDALISKVPQSKHSGLSGEAGGDRTAGVLTHGSVRVTGWNRT